MSAPIPKSRDELDAQGATERALRESEERFRALVELSSDWYWEQDEDLRFLPGRQSAQKDLLRAASYVGKTRWEVVGASLDDPAWAAHKALLERREPFQDFEYGRIGGDGVYRWVSISGQPVFDAEGRFRGYRGIGRDITARRRAEEEARRKDAFFRSMVENLSDAIGATDMDWRYLYVGPSSERVMGFRPEELVGRRFADPTAPAEGEALRRDLAARLQKTGLPQSARFTARYKDGRLRTHEVVVSKGTGPDGEPIYVIVGRDVTDRIAAEEQLRKREEEFRAVAENAPDGIMRFDRELRCLYANAALTRTSGHAAEWFVGRRLEEFGLPAEVEHALRAALGAALESGETQTLEFKYPGPRGERHYQARLAPERGPDGRPVTVLGISRDITARIRFEQHIQHVATHDRLTGLPNRTLLDDRVEQAIVHARRSEGSLALLFVDLDQFKLVNDSFGHAAGDMLLMEVASRLRATVREGDTVARLGGDEFVILLTDLKRPGDSAVVAKKIAEALDKPVLGPAGDLRVTASIGISLYPDDGTGLDSLLQCADAAMYRAKDAGRNAYQYYSSEMSEQARARVETEAGLRRAMEQGEFRIHFQPQVEVASGAVATLEALLRWEHPQHGMVSPAAFIPVAEESGLILPIGQWALHAACREAAAWAAAGLKARVSVNLSARQFWRGSVTELVRAALGETGLAASQLEIEITESVVARDLQQVTLTLEQLRRMGVSVAIDDFGTGYSSLAYLRSLPIQRLKIDKSFIHNIPADREATALVGEIVRLAHVLSLGVVAEGVETPEQARFLREAGCESMQGFLFARPLPPAEAAGLLHSGRRFLL
jgi:diguanylate cyclase (GGDEF)-like protein/PAS domain S-box-containing protein